MILSGDEFGNTQYGNNNAYCQDSEISWLDWSKLDQNRDLFRYAQGLIELRNHYDILKSRADGREQLIGQYRYPEISWHGVQAWNGDFSESSRCLGILFYGTDREDREIEDFIYAALNTHWEGHEFQLPQLPGGYGWYVFANTGMGAGEDIFPLADVRRLENQGEFMVGPRSAIILIGKKEE